jgi:uncharacterized membrane protein
VAKSLSDVDLSWLVGLVVVCPLYYYAARHYLVRKPPTGDLGADEIPVVEVT